MFYVIGYILLIAKKTKLKIKIMHFAVFYDCDLSPYLVKYSTNVEIYKKFKYQS